MTRIQLSIPTWYWSFSTNPDIFPGFASVRNTHDDQFLYFTLETASTIDYMIYLSMGLGPVEINSNIAVFCSSSSGREEIYASLQMAAVTKNRLECSFAFLAEMLHSKRKTVNAEGKHVLKGDCQKMPGKTLKTRTLWTSSIGNTFNSLAVGQVFKWVWLFCIIKGQLWLKNTGKKKCSWILHHMHNHCSTTNFHVTCSKNFL